MFQYVFVDILGLSRNILSPALSGPPGPSVCALFGSVMTDLDPPVHIFRKIWTPRNHFKNMDSLNIFGPPRGVFIFLQSIVFGAHNLYRQSNFAQFNKDQYNIALMYQKKHIFWQSQYNKHSLVCPHSISSDRVVSFPHSKGSCLILL